MRISATARVYVSGYNPVLLSVSNKTIAMLQVNVLDLTGWHKKIIELLTYSILKL
jgi:hypothetical protein